MASIPGVLSPPDNPFGLTPTADDAFASTSNQPALVPHQDELAILVRSWWTEARNSAFWKDWIEAADEDMAFYLGGKGQWLLRGAYKDYEKLVQDKRVVVSINHIRPVILLLAGYERGNRFDLKTVPQGDQDVESAQMMTHILKYAQEQTEAQDTLSEMFDEGNITGMDVCEIGVDYTGDKPVNGEITVQRLRPGHEIIWDPKWRTYDFVAGPGGPRYMIKWQWTYVDDVIAEHPEHAAEIRAAATALGTIVRESGHTTKPRGDAYGYVRSHPVEQLDDIPGFYDAENDRVLVVEAWYRVYYDTYSVFDTTTGQITQVDTKADADARVASDPEHLQVHRQMAARVRMGTVLPALYLSLEEDKNPYPNDDTRYPFVAYLAERKRDTVLGVVRNLKDPQRLENKRWSQVGDLLAKWTYLRPMVPKGSITEPATLNDASATNPLEYDPTKGAPGWYTAPVQQLGPVLEALALQMKLNVREISGVNAEAQGLKQDVSSGVAVARRQQQTQVMSTMYFDQLRKTRRNFGKRLARRAQQVYTTEDFMRVTGDYGETVLVKIGTKKRQISDQQFHQWAQSMAGAGKPAILRDLDSLKYDVVLSDMPATPSARAAALEQMIELVEKIPMLAPALLDILVDMTDIPRKAEVMARVRRLIPPQLLGEAPGPATGPNPLAMAGTEAGGPPGQPNAPPAQGPPGGGPHPGHAVPAAAMTQPA